MPVIEPVKKNIKDLLLSIKNLNDKGIKPILILNPNIGEYKDNPNLFYQQLTNNDIKIDFLPCVNLNTPNHIFFFNKFENISILFDEYFELNDSFNEKVKYTFLPIETEEKILNKLNNVVLYGDFFPKIKRNADYPSESLLTNLNVDFNSKTNVIGYGDFTITPKKYSTGGGPAYVVAVHSTFTDLSRENHKYVKHYLSYDDDSTKNVAKKFNDAVTKFLNDVDSKKISYFPTTAINDFRSYMNKNHYPGLGVSKRISIKHHIETANEFLKSA